MRRLLCLLAGSFALSGLAAAPASAAWIGAQKADGPGKLVRVGGAAIGADGTGAVTYVKKIGDRKHHDRDRVGMLVRVTAGRLGKPLVIARGAVDDIQVAAGTDGRLAIAWIAKGVLTAVVSGQGGLAAPVDLGTGAHPGTLSLRMNPAGVAYAVWTQDGAGGTDVRAAQLAGATWTALGAPLDADPNRAAGTGALRPAIGVAADGSAVAAWGEVFPDGSTHVFARRLTGTDSAPAPLEAGVPALGTEPGGNADSPVVDAERSGEAAWVGFRQDVGTRSRTLARRFTDVFGDPLAIDGGTTSRNPSLAVASTKSGLGAAGAADGTVIGSVLTTQGTFAAPVRLDEQAARSAVAPIVAWSDFEPQGEAAFRGQTAAGLAVAFGRGLSQADGAARLRRISGSTKLGPVVSGSLRMGSDAAADAILPMLQGTRSDQRVLTIALQDSPPGPPKIAARYYAGPHPRLTWVPGDEAFGPQRFQVSLDGRSLGTTSATALRTSGTVRDGRHTAQVTATDSRKQSTTGPERTIIVDSVAPQATITTSRAGRVVRVKVRSADDRSGIASVTVRWRDGTSSTSTHRRRTFRHRFAAKGPHRVTVVVRDRAGNQLVRTLTA